MDSSKVRYQSFSSSRILSLDERVRNLETAVRDLMKFIDALQTTEFMRVEAQKAVEHEIDVQIACEKLAIDESRSARIEEALQRFHVSANMVTPLTAGDGEEPVDAVQPLVSVQPHSDGPQMGAAPINACYTACKLVYDVKAPKPCTFTYDPVVPPRSPVRRKKPAVSFARTVVAGDNKADANWRGDDVIVEFSDNDDWACEFDAYVSP